MLAQDAPTPGKFDRVEHGGSNLLRLCGSYHCVVRKW